MREEEIVSTAANAEKGKMRLKAIITDPIPYTENKREAGLTSNSFGFPLLSQETPVRPLLRQHFTIPGPALEAPANPSAAENGLPLPPILWRWPHGNDGDEVVGRSRAGRRRRRQERRS
eukprot:1426395-Pyramimonas_sp.AAC.1